MIVLAEAQFVISLYQIYTQNSSKCINAIELHHRKRHEKLGKRRKEMEKIKYIHMHIYCNIFSSFGFYFKRQNALRISNYLRSVTAKATTSRVFLYCKMPGRFIKGSRLLLASTFLNSNIHNNIKIRRNSAAQLGCYKMNTYH